MFGILFYFIVSWAFAIYMIRDLLTDEQPNPSSQYACLTKFVIGPPLMLFFHWTGMALAVIISGVVLFSGKYISKFFKFDDLKKLFS